MPRLDQLLVQQGLAHSRTQAQKLIASRCVEVFTQGLWQVCSKPASQFDAPPALRIAALDELQFASRAGLKLQRALQHLNWPISGSWLDIGQSTGGFTDCLLQAGASQVIGIEVGKDQLIERLRTDPRVICLEGINGRALPIEKLNPLAPAGFSGAVMDVSFISQTLIHPQLARVLPPGGKLLSLVKPQFEAGPEYLGKGGLINNPAAFEKVQAKIIASMLQLGFELVDYFDSAITGGDGNREFFVAAINSTHSGTQA
ncbi:MAG TPA: TlyA family RNA methyltransferase [Cellvibrionaceae bacterium]|nr:TlyA family RNA methyltransferase [Cellvibrionaceae bacterium]HMW71577.1 TlyA family RNA methyltransferase [Cellvibrionaceae bacterium]HNG59509.1 TlyA family RNA methyltransferase [Cellvibrionaceae bacterium]